MSNDVAAHEQREIHRYTIRFPAHEARESDPHYHLFEETRKRLKASDKWRCAVGVERGDFSECDSEHPLELHHAHLEYALANAVDLEWLTRQIPDVADEEQLQVWLESAANCVVLCRYHHRGHEGVHVLSAADWEAARFVKGLVDNG